MDLEGGMMEAKRHMQIEARNHSQSLCHVRWKHFLYLQYDPATVTCKRCLTIMGKEE